MPVIIQGHRSLFYSKNLVFGQNKKNFTITPQVLENIATLVHLKFFCQK